MKYAIETLEIEANKLKEAIRTEERYSVYPEYVYQQIEFKERLVAVLKAIDILQRTTADINTQQRRINHDSKIKALWQ